MKAALQERIAAYFADEMMCNRNQHAEGLLREAATEMERLRAQSTELHDIAKRMLGVGERLRREIERLRAENAQLDAQLGVWREEVQSWRNR